MLERSFIEALQADPNDEVSRLVYADWLDEQGDFRGEFLRAEMAYFRGEATLLHVSELAARAAPAWLCDVALMAGQVEKAWDRTGRSFAELGGDATAGWAETEEALAANLGKHGLRRDEFVVPYDYALFQHLFPGGWFRAGGPREECAIWAAEMVRSRTEFWYDEAPFLRPGPPGGAGVVPLWLSIGTPWSSHEEHFLCCARSLPRFGEVVLVDDDCHPGQLPADDPARLGASHVEYLRRLAL
jgi:uncharacterized protein (TIGR02996 family)